MLAFRAFSYLSVLVWTVVGLIIIGSVYLSTSYFFANLTIGLLFMCVGGYVYLKERSFHKFIYEACKNIPDDKTRNILIWELSFVIGTLLVGCLFLIAVWSRVFGEGYAVFG